MAGRNRRPPKGSSRPSSASSTSKPPINESGASFEDDYNYQLELCWCIQKLQIGLNSCKNRQQAAEAVRTLRILQNPETPKVKKRQTMKATFGDYRAKMRKEESEKFKAKQEPSVSDTTHISGRVIHRRPQNPSGDIVSEHFQFNFDIDDGNENDK